jgi:hypothetical protein
MRLGLIGTGKQGQRYLQERNGGRHIVVSGSRRIPLDDVDGVIIATHPAGHKELALEAIAAGKPVLIEKPLALNLADCMEIIDAAEKAGVACQVAHTHLWSEGFRSTFTASDDAASGFVEYVEHERDYSPWLDWAPHVLAMLAALDVRQHEGALNARCRVTSGSLRRMCIFRKRCGSNGLYDVYLGREGANFDRDIKGDPPPQAEFTAMHHMMMDFRTGRSGGYGWSRFDYDFNRRVYRALFAQENHATC